MGIKQLSPKSVIFNQGTRQVLPCGGSRFFLSSFLVLRFRFLRASRDMPPAVNIASLTRLKRNGPIQLLSALQRTFPGASKMWEPVNKNGHDCAEVRVVATY